MSVFDIIVPTFNRDTEIRKFVEEIRKQKNGQYEVIILDDHGDISPERHVPKDDSRFKFIRLTKNVGQSKARNIGIKEGLSDIVVSLDDDAWFIDDDALSRLEKYFQRYPDLGCVMFDVLTPDGVWL